MAKETNSCDVICQQLICHECNRLEEILQDFLKGLNSFQIALLWLPTC